MFVKEFNNTSAAELNKQLEKVYKWHLNLNSLKEGTVDQMLETVKSQINTIRKSSQVHHAERNPKYMEAVMVSKVLETWKNEMAQGRKIIAEKLQAIDAYCMTQLNERELTPAELKKREHYAMALKGKAGDFKKRYGKRGKDVMYATATKMAKNESYILPPALTEGEIEQARVTMAARDLADTVQDIVAKISDMQNEQLPALVSAMKDEIGMEQANSFNDSTKQTLQSLLDAANTARDTLDNASRGVYGSQAPMGAMPDAAPTGDLNSDPDMGGVSGAEAPMPPRDGGDLDTADSAVGGPAELGRGKRV